MLNIIVRHTSTGPLMRNQSEGVLLSAGHGYICSQSAVVAVDVAALLPISTNSVCDLHSSQEQICTRPGDITNTRSKQSSTRGQKTITASVDRPQDIAN